MFCSYTIHSESSAFVPAEEDQFPKFPDNTDDFLTKVWSLVASVTPATSHPFPGSVELHVPIQSIILKEDSVPSTKQKPSSPLLK